MRSTLDLGILSGVALLGVAAAASGCSGDVHCDWRDEVCEPPLGPGRSISGRVLDLANALPVFAEERFTQESLAAEAKVSGVRVCVIGAHPEICSHPSAPDDGSYELHIPSDSPFYERHANLYADIESTPGAISAREWSVVRSPPSSGRAEPDRNVYVASSAWLEALASRSGVGTAAEVLNRGVGIILSSELQWVGYDFIMPKRIDVDATGAVSRLFAVTYDPSQPGGIGLDDMEALGEDAAFPMAVAAYVADGTANTIAVEMCDREGAQGPTLVWTQPTFSNSPGITILPRPTITNPLTRFRDYETPECLR